MAVSERVVDAVLTGDEKLLSHLLTSNPSLVRHTVDQEGTTLLHLAANSSCHMVEVLVRNGADINSRNGDGYTPLHVAAMNGCVEGVKVLLRLGADCEVLDEEWMTAEEEAQEMKETECVLLLRDHQTRLQEDHELDQSMCQAFVDMMIDISSDHDVTLVQEEEQKVSIPSEVSSLTNEQLRKRLLDLGERPGPVTDGTRTAYEIYLTKILSGTQTTVSKTLHSGFRYELSLCISGAVPIPNMADSEVDVFSKFRTDSMPKTHFVYLLIDPSGRAIEPEEQFREFVGSIFYVGKGKNSRSTQHLKEAKVDSNKSRKAERIREIWASGRGIACHQIYNNIAAPEAFCREAAIIDAIGLANLTNAVRGHYHGAMTTWSAAQRRKMGVYLLHKAHQLYTINKPPQLFSKDI